MNDVAPSRYKFVGTRPIRPDGVPKVTGKAMYAADMAMPGALYGKIVRSPHAHARIKSINTEKAKALPGVKAVITGADFPEHKFEYIGPERVAVNFWHVSRNVMAKEKVLYEGHAVAAIAAISKEAAEEAEALIEIEYEVLPHAIDVDEAMKEDAPLLFEDMITRGVEPAPTKPSNISKKLEFAIGDVEKGFAEADVVVEKDFKTAAVHQGYIEPHACSVRMDADGQGEIWSSSQGHFVVRALTAKLPATSRSAIWCAQSRPRSAAGSGGKTVVYVEPVAALLSTKTGRAVKITMSRDEVFKATGPTSGASMTVKIGVKKDGMITAAQGVFRFQAGAFPGSPVMNGCLCAFAPYEIANQHTVGYDVVCNRPKSAAYRAPGSPISAFAVESVIDMCAKKIGMDPVELRLKNAAKPGTPMIYGPKLGHGGYIETLEAVKNHPAYKEKLGPNQGRGVASGYWFNGGGESSATIQVNSDGTITVATGSVDVGGSRASMALMAAETFGVDYSQVRAIVADTSSVGYTHVTGGSRVTFATGTAVVDAAKKAIDELRARAALIWDVDVEGVVWEDGHAKPSRSNVGDFKPMSLKELAGKAAVTGGPITTAASVNAGGQAPGFATQFCDVEVDPETGKVDDPALCRGAGRVGTAIHPSLCRGGRSRAVSCRASAGRSTRSTSTTRRVSSITPASSITAARSPATCR